MVFGLTTDGLVIKRLDDIKTEIEAALRTTLGNSINLLPTELLGQIVGIISEREALIYEDMQDVYYSQHPDTASGVALDNVVAITGIQRLEATKGTGTVTAYGTLGTVIPVGSVISVDGLASSRFVTTTDNTIAAGTNEVQDIDFSAVPDAGTWTLIFDGEETGSLAYNDPAATIETTLEALSNLTSVTVSGNYTSGFTITFTGVDGSQNQPLLQVGTNTLTNTSVQVNLTFAETTPGVLPNVDMLVEAESAGEINAYAGTLTVIESPLSGWDSVTNELDIVPGTNIETDAALRLRRNQTLSTAGVATVEAIRARLLEIDEVTEAQVFENVELTTDGSGRPGKSFEAVVLGGDDAEIAQTIWDVKPAGIYTYGSTTETVTDTQGFDHDISFSRPDEIEIYVVVNLTVDSNYPVDGDTALKEAIIALTDDEFGIGDDVITIRLFDAVNSIAGVLDADIFVGTAPSPVSDANITIADDEIAAFDTARITVTS